MTSAMSKGYQPKSDFLCMVANEEVSLTGSEVADHNLRLLVAFTRDPEASNRDWATMLLAQQETDIPEVRQALFAAANDCDGDVRAEALLGLAERDKDLARPLVEHELTNEKCGYGVIEAALLIAHPSLLDGLRSWTGRSTEPWWNDLVNEAIAACGASRP